jgi:DNA-binding XRE family transcriptional regulator
MGRVAASGYLQRIRELHNLSRAQVAAKVGVTEQSIYRIESMAQEPKAEILMTLISAVYADVRDVYELMLAKDATREDGEQRAEKAFAAKQHRLEQDEMRESIEQQLADIRLRLSLLEGRGAHHSQTPDRSLANETFDSSQPEVAPAKSQDVGLDPA